MKFFAAVLLFTSAVALAAPAEDVNSGVEDVNTSAADFADGDFSINEIATGTCDRRGYCKGRFANRRHFTRRCTDGSCRGRKGRPCNVSTNVRPNRVVCPGAH